MSREDEVTDLTHDLWRQVPPGRGGLRACPGRRRWGSGSPGPAPRPAPQAGQGGGPGRDHHVPDLRDARIRASVLMVPLEAR